MPSSREVFRGVDAAADDDAADDEVAAPDAELDDDADARDEDDVFDAVGAISSELHSTTRCHNNKNNNNNNHLTASFPGLPG